jgi:predicted ATPase
MEKPPLHVQRIYVKGNMERDESSYPFNVPVIRTFRELILRKTVTFIIGENGSGKSTLIEAIAVACGFNPEGGSKNFNFKTMESHSSFHEYLTVSRTANREKDGYFLRAESFYNVASEIERLDKEGGGPPIKTYYGGKSLHEQSHGESFMALLENRLYGNGLYIFDEPEAALSPMRLLRLLVRIDELVKAGSQFIISTHSPIVMAYPDADIYDISSGEMRITKMEDTEHYFITKHFLTHTEQMLVNLGIMQR